MISEIRERPSAKVLLLMNLLPLAGVIFWGWSVFNIVLLYWMENLMLGVINILKMLTCRPDVRGMKEMALKKIESGEVSEDERKKWRAKVEAGEVEKVMLHGHSAVKLFMIPFFTVHYFGFCAGHGFFVFSFFGNGTVGSGLLDPFAKVPEMLTGGFLLAAIGLLISHLYSFFSNYLGRGEYKKTVVPLLMFQPYGRIVALHVAIVFGGFAVVALGSPIGLLLVLIAGKIVIDLKMHLREHAKVSAAKTGSPLLGALMRGRN